MLLLLDRLGQIISCNIGGKTADRFNADGVVGRSHAVFYPPDEVIEGRPNSDLDDAARIGVLVRDAWRMRGDGTEYLARLSITPLCDEGEIVGFGVVSRDITDEAAARVSAEAREQHLRSILETVPDAMIVIDEAGLITSFSAAAERLFGFIEAEVLGQNISCLMPEPDATRHDGYVRHYLDTGERRIIGIGRVVRGRKRDGTVFPMQLSIGEAGEDGQRVFTGFVRDLTAKEQDELKLRELQAELVHVSRLSAMGTMASTLAHELNQPLTAVALYLETARDILMMPQLNRC
jgi:two-component system sensor kinase FixL